MISMNRNDNRVNTKSLKVNAVVNMVKTVLSLVFPLITFPYVSRVLGVNQMGKYNFANSVISYFLLIAALGISTYAIREGTQYRNNQKAIDEFASEMFSINLVSTVAAYVALFVCLLLVRRFDSCRTEILIFSIEIIATTIGIEWIYNIYEDFVFIAVRSLIFQCISLVLLFLLVRGPGDVDKYVAVTVIAFSGNNILNWFHAKNYCHIHITKSIDWKRHLKPILVIFSTSVATTIYVSSDTTMLGFLVNDNNYSVGIYFVATKIYNIFKNVIVAFLVVLIPRFSMLVHMENGKEKVSALFNRLSTIVITLVTPMMFCVIMLASDIIRIVSGSKYLSAVTSFRILMMACLFSFFAYLFAQCILIPNRREKSFFIATAISATINVGLNFFLIPYIHEVGAAITTLIAELITMMYVIKGSKGCVNFKILKKDIASTIMGTAAIVLICALGNQYISFMFIRVVMCTLLSAVAYVIVLKTMKNSIIDEVARMLKRKIRLKGLQ